MSKGNEEFIRMVLKKTHLKKLPPLESLLTRHPHRKREKLSELSFIDDYDCIIPAKGLESASRYLRKNHRDELNECHPPNARLKISKCLDLAVDAISRGGIINAVQIVEIPNLLSNHLLAGRHRCAFVGLLYGFDSKIPIEMNREDSIENARRSASVMNDSRKEDLLEKSSRNVLDTIANVQKDSDQKRQCVSTCKDSLIAVRLADPDLIGYKTVSLPYEPRVEQGDEASAPTLGSVKDCLSKLTNLGPVKSKYDKLLYFEKMFDNGISFLSVYHNEIVNLLEEGMKVLSELSSDKAEKIREAIIQAEDSLYSILHSSNGMKALGEVAYLALYMTEEGESISTKYDKGKLVAFEARRFARAVLHGFFNYAALSKGRSAVPFYAIVFAKRGLGKGSSTSYRNKSADTVIMKKSKRFTSNEIEMRDAYLKISNTKLPWELALEEVRKTNLQIVA